jgi:hypothetical protein
MHSITVHHTGSSRVLLQSSLYMCLIDDKMKQMITFSLHIGAEKKVGQYDF